MTKEMENKKLLKEQADEVSGGCPPPCDPPVEMPIVADKPIPQCDAGPKGAMINTNRGLKF